VNMFKNAGRSFAGFAGKTGKLFGQADGNGISGYDLGGVEVLDGRPFGFEPEPRYRKSPKPSPAPFDISALLRLRTFAYLILATALFIIQIYNTLAINELAKRNEKLREQLRISTSITTAEELTSRETQSIRNISERAKKIGLEYSFAPPVEIEP
jgi:hypothetical protein